MKNNSFLQAVFNTFYALLFLILEGIYQTFRFTAKWLFIGLVVLVKALIFLIMLPLPLYKAAKRAVFYRSVIAGWQLLKWTWADYWDDIKF